MKEKVTITIDKDLLDFVNNLANQDSRSLSSTINRIISEYKNQNKSKNTTTII